MCSILGQISVKDKLINTNDFIEASDLLEHRGPDKKGLLTDNSTYQFAFNRLSILDVSENGDQPMKSECGNYICIFNGEIYNHKKIFSLIKKKFKWRGTSDTEILLNAWSIWEEKTLNIIDGMFAFAIWNIKQKKLIIARDRIGEKPLYYYLDDDKSLFFCSRPSPIIKIFPHIRNQLDQKSVEFYDTYGFFPRNHSVFKGIKKLEPGCFLEFSNKQLNKEKYWSVNSYNSKNFKFKKLDHYVDELDYLLTESISERLISDKPVGFLLSGGLDSSLIVSIAAKVINKKNINAFNLGFDIESYDESNDAELVTNYLGIQLFKKKLSPTELINLFPIFFKRFDEPFTDPASFPLMEISKFAKTKVDVVLTGDGGDELFGGYNNYSYIALLKKFSPIFYILQKSYFPNILKKFGNHKMKLLGNLFSYKDNISRFAFMRSARKDFKSVYKSINHLEVINSYFKDYNLLKKEKDFVNKIMKLDILNTLNDNYLQKTDLSTMAFSLESRSPFLSKKIIEWSLTLPSKYKVSLFSKKIVLKKLAEKYLPQEIIIKKKQGFEIPLKEWLKKDLKDWSLGLIKNKKNYINLNLDQDKIFEIFNLHLSGKRDCHPYLWTILMILKFNEK